MTTNLPIPTVHLNGTSRDELIEQLRAAHRAVREAMVAVSKSCPNGRDYYLNGTISQALAAHTARLDHLEAVARELEQLWHGVEEQQSGRRASR